MFTKFPGKQATSLAKYQSVAERSSAVVINAYSTSFGWSARLLGKNERRRVRNIYALVRVADEIVDGAATEALKSAIGVDPHLILDQLEEETYRAMKCGFSSNLVVQAFAHTAREVGIEKVIVQPFFNSMRQDLVQRVHDRRSFVTYVYGSAEVVGLMCLRAFLHGIELSAEQRSEFEAGARALGSAFQKVNFLRDLAADFDKLGRSYFPLVKVDEFNDIERDRLVADINKDLDLAKKALAKLPSSSRRAVSAAHMFFAELNKKIAKTPASELIKKRIRVSNQKKIWILIKSIFGVQSR